MRRPSESLSVFRIETVAKYFPIWIALFIIINFVLRVFISPNLDIDMAAFVGHTDFKIYYDNSHPPLFNWMTAIMLELTGNNWVLATSIIKYSLMLAILMLAWDATRLITNNNITAMLVVCCILLIPQFLWVFQARLAHTILVTLGSVATLHALVRIIHSGKWYDYIWLGIGFSIGTLAKFNFPMFLGAVILAAMLIKEARQALINKLTALSFATYLAISGPVILFTLMNIKASSERLSKMYTNKNILNAIDLPYVGINGIIHLCINTILWMLPAILAYYILFRLKLTDTSDAMAQDRTSHEKYIKLFKYIPLICLGTFALIVFFGDINTVHIRYLTPILMSAPFWLVLAYPISHNRQAIIHLTRFTAVMAIGVTIVMSVTRTLNGNMLSYPFREFTQEIIKKHGDDIHIHSRKGKYRKNFHIHMPDAKTNESAKKTVVVWNIYGNKKPAISNNVQPAGEPFILEQSYYYSSKKAKLYGQLYIRK